MAFTFEMLLTLSLMIFAIIGYSTRKFPIDAVSISVLGLLFLIFEIFPVKGISIDNFIQGFANHGLLTVMALLVVAQGVYSTGILNTFVDNIMHLNKDLKTSKNTLLILLLLMVALFSSVMNNTPIIIIFIPLVSIIAEKMNLSISKALIPLSYAGILGGMTTLVGSSTNIIGAEVAKDLGVDGINFFSVTIPGLAIAIPGLLFVLFILPKIMPKRINTSISLSNSQDKFIAQIEIDTESDLIGQESKNGTFSALPEMKILLIQRGEHSLSAYQNTKIQKDDILVISADRTVIESALIKYGEQLHPTISDTDNINFNDNNINSGEQILAEVLVSPDSRMAGRDLEESRFRKFTNCIVLGIKRSSKIYREQITDIILEAGDVLLIQGSKQSVNNLKEYPDILLLDHTSTILPRKKYARRSLAIFLFTVITIATGIIPSVAAAMIGASAMLASRVLSAERAINSLNRHVFLTIVSMLALSHAIVATGLAQYGAYSMLNYFPNSSPAMIISILFLTVSIMTNFLTNNASAALFMPLGISIASSLNIDVLPFVITIILAANCSFATPYGYQTNLLVMAAGDYKFKHFVKGGVPLTIICWLAFTLFAPWYYNLY
ncbi:MAG: hypothetical protein CFH33_01428 [Alphaproteobacteria bacterium MarineAlpha9_Bin3]|nr:MAG: hypothetical protein CFH33_01428 [Alphaproteobacteria bacterium MarineAlpha9_Bin3]|tara:strand:+ start:1280 stop:3106 length:1827 start_codon:yes stop_codon:yes gene_type:complete